MKSKGFPRRARMRARVEFLRTQRSGTKLHTKHFLVFYSSSQLDAHVGRDRVAFARLGVTVTKKVGNAVVRNKVKRRVRELFRHHLRDLPERIDLVVVAKHTAAVATFPALQEDFERLVRRMMTDVRPGAGDDKSAKKTAAAGLTGAQES